MNAEDTGFYLVPLAKKVCRHSRCLDRSALRQYYSVGVVQAVAGDRLVAASRLACKRFERGLQTLVDRGIEIRVARGRAEREALLLEQCARERGFIEIVPGRQAPSGGAKEKLLCGRRRLDLIMRGTDKTTDLRRRQQSRVLRGEGGLLVVHDNHARYQRRLGHASRDVSEVDRLLHVGREQHEEAGVRTQMDAFMTAAEGRTMRRDSAGAEMQDQGRVFARRGHQQVLACRDIGSGQERRRAPARQRHAGRGRNPAPRAFGAVHRVAGNGGFGQRDRRITVEHRVQAFLADV